MAEDVVVLTGVKETIDALKDFDKDAVKRFNKVINNELSNAERDARSLVAQIGQTPMSGWKPYDAKNGKTRGGAGWPGWNSGVIQSGIRKTKAQGKVRGDYTTSAGALVNKSAAGSIFEIAGRNWKGNAGGGSGNQFQRTLMNRFGKASRLVWRVIDKDASEIQARVKRALDEAKAELQKHLSRERA